MTAAQDEARVDTRDMLVVHGALRREFRLASVLSASVGKGTWSERGWLPTISALSCGSFTGTTPARTCCCGPSCSTESPTRSRPSCT